MFQRQAVPTESSPPLLQDFPLLLPHPTVFRRRWGSVRIRRNQGCFAFGNSRSRLPLPRGHLQVLARRLECSVLFGKRSRETLLQGPLGHVLTYGILWEPQKERLYGGTALPLEKPQEPRVCTLVSDGPRITCTTCEAAAWGSEPITFGCSDSK